MPKVITTAVFPVAGMGTRFLPVTKSSPKEMLPIVDKPLIQYVVEEAVAAGITQLVLVTSDSKRAVEDYFDSNFALEKRLEEKEQWALLEIVRSIVPKEVSIVYVRQRDPLGLGHAVLSAKKIVGDHPFAVLLADDIIDCGHEYCLKKMIEVYQETEASVIAVEEIALSDTKKYGMVSLASNPDIPYRMNGIIEKPDAEFSPSQLAVIGRYILTPTIFKFLEMMERGVGGEIQLTDAIAKLLQVEPVVAFPFEGKRYDCGTKLGFLEATIAYALKRSDLGVDFRQFLEKMLRE